MMIIVGVITLLLVCSANEEQKKLNLKNKKKQ